MYFTVPLSITLGTELLRLSQDATIVRTFDGTVVWMNPAAETLYGISLEEAQGKKIHDLLQTGFPVSQAEQEAALWQDGHWSGELLHRCKDGRERIVSSRQSLLQSPEAGESKNATGKNLFVLESNRDITAERQAERLLTEHAQTQEAIARILQESLLLSPSTDAFPGLSVAPVYLSAQQEALIGGDFYDVFRVTEEKIALVVGDASGKGVAAASYTAEVKFALRAFLHEQDRLSVAIERLNVFISKNQQLMEEQRDGTYIALVVGLLDTETGEIQVCVAGAEPAIVVHSNGTARIITAGGPILGAMPEATYETQTIPLTTDETLVFLTDGVTEARQPFTEPGHPPEFFGIARLLSYLREFIPCSDGETAPLEQVGQNLVKAFRAFTQGQQRDDICLLLARRETTGQNREGAKKPRPVSASRLPLSLTEPRVGSQRVLDSDLVGIIRWSLDGNITEANDYFLDMLGYSRTDLEAGRVNWKTITPTEWVSADEEASREILATGKHRPFEKVYRAKNGTLVPVIVGGVFLPGSRTNGVSFVLNLTEQKRAEEERRATDARFRVLFETMTQGIIYWGQVGEALDCNPAAERILGMTREQILAPPGFHAWPHPILREDGSPFPLEELPGVVAMRTGKPEKNVVIGTFNPVRNQYIWLRMDAVPEFRPGETKPYQVYGIYTDITEERHTQKELAEALRIREERWQVAIQNDGDGIWDFDLRTGKIYYSPQWKAIMGYQEEELPNSYYSWKDHAHPDDIAPVEAAIQAHLDGKTPMFRVEYRIRHKNGHYIWVYDRGRVLRDESGGHIRSIGFRTDITERKRAEAERSQYIRTLESQEERWRLAIQGNTDGLWDWNVLTGEVYFSPQWKAIIGYEDREIEHNFREWESRVHPDDLPQAVADIKAHIEGKTPIYRNEHRMRHKNGHWVWIHTRGQAVYDSNGTAYRAIGYHTDITEQVRLRQERERNESQLRQILRELMFTVTHGVLRFCNTARELPEPLPKVSGRGSGTALGNVAPPPKSGGSGGRRDAMAAGTDW